MLQKPEYFIITGNRRKNATAGEAKKCHGCSAASGVRYDLPPVGWGSHKFYILWNLQNYNIEIILIHFLYKSFLCNPRTPLHLHLYCVVVEVSRCPIKPETNVQTAGVMGGCLQWRGVH